ncbi:hypothetical protein EQG68_09365 [Flavobacterium piscinae]|uniref:Tetratricopeptide repeat protein n=1 Tax=Flavobacterium piscinae TaxID=2506424 RepID=A0A4Q1KPG7_9FLAO|nr:hypothetical protein [Flavobacterium piscinae]RXR31868.1 hypothetical protein EQG68_09365 [Flavobacterium piscinae]
MKNNRALIGKRKSMFSSKKDYLSSPYENEHTEFIDHKTASPELLEEIRNKLLKEKKKSFIVNILFILLIIAFTIAVTIYYFSNVKKADENQKTAQIESFKLSKTHKDFQLLIKDGDEWMETGNFENAIFRYKSAAKLIPNQFDVEYRICLGYAYLCRYENLECEQGKIALEQAISTFPNQQKLIELRKYY